MFDGNSEVEEIFSQAWQKVLAGHSIESVVAEYPDYAAEIEPMLRLTAAVRVAVMPAPVSIMKAKGPCPFSFTSITGIQPRICMGATATLEV